MKKVGRYTWIDGKKPDYITDDGKIDIWYLEEIKKIKVNEI